MHPICTRCNSAATRRVRRRKNFMDRLRHFFGYYPWECMDCQMRFYSQKRQRVGERSLHGEIYVEGKKRFRTDGAPASPDNKE